MESPPSRTALLASDGRRIAFVIDAPESGPYAGQGGLHVGEFVIDRCSEDGQRRVPRACG